MAAKAEGSHRQYDISEAHNQLLMEGHEHQAERTALPCPSIHVPGAVLLKRLLSASDNLQISIQSTFSRKPKFASCLLLGFMLSMCPTSQFQKMDVLWTIHVQLMQKYAVLQR